MGLGGIASGVFEYDAIEQMTRDRTRELYMAYDYKGQLVMQDSNSNLATPERHFTYDCQGKRCTENSFYDLAGVQTRFETVVLINGCCAGGGCCGDTLGDVKLEESHYNSAGAETGRVQYVTGLGAIGSGSSSVVHPMTAATPRLGRGHAKVIVHGLAKQGATTEHRFRYEDRPRGQRGHRLLSGCLRQGPFISQHGPTFAQCDGVVALQLGGGLLACNLCNR